MRANAIRATITPRQVLLLGTPLILGLLALTRPPVSGPPAVLSQVRPYADYWLALHLLLLPLFGLLALAGYQLTAEKTGRAALVSRVAFAWFALLSIASLALLGVGTGVLARAAHGLPVAQQATLSAITDALWQSRVVVVLGILTSVAWWLAMVAAAVTLSRPTISRQLVRLVVVLSGAVLASGLIEGTNTPLWWLGLLAVMGLFAYAAEPRALAALLAASALLFSAGYAAPYGPLAMLCFLAAAALLTLPVSALLPAPSRSRTPAAGPRTARHARR
ncbi:MAG: hypothetical protein IVW57_09240 [Ktedonobacterales bacterium]|nr:hypothetical protein [Ktedonobacterales bacterium]